MFIFRDPDSTTSQSAADFFDQSCDSSLVRKVYMDAYILYEAQIQLDFHFCSASFFHCKHKEDM